MRKVAVIGAGISGLSVAHFLRDKYNVVIFEKEEQPGGLIRCSRINGSLFHQCGGHVFNSKRKDVLEWFWSMFNRDASFTKSERNSVVYMEDGNVVPYPIENHVYLLNEGVQRNFIEDMLNIYKEGNCSHLNFEEFLRGRFGETLYKLYFRPYNKKVWRRDLKTVPLTWLKGKLPMPTVEEMIYNNINQVKEKSFVHSTFWYEKQGGSQFIVDTLAENLCIRYSSSIERMIYDGKRWMINNELYDAVVFCGNIKQMVHAIEGVDVSEYYNEVDELEYHGTTAVFCEIDKNPYSWIYLPSQEYDSHRIICTGNFCASNNDGSIPDSRSTATIEFTDEVDLDYIRENLKKMPLNPQYITHKYNKYSYPIQNERTQRMIRELKENLSSVGFYFTGRFADWEYYNMDAAIGAAMDLCNDL